MNLSNRFSRKRIILKTNASGASTHITPPTQDILIFLLGRRKIKMLNFGRHQFYWCINVFRINKFHNTFFEGVTFTKYVYNKTYN